MFSKLTYWGALLPIFRPTTVFSLTSKVTRCQALAQLETEEGWRSTTFQTKWKREKALPDGAGTDLLLFLLSIGGWWLRQGITEPLSWSFGLSGGKLDTGGSVSLEKSMIRSHTHFWTSECELLEGPMVLLVSISPVFAARLVGLLVEDLEQDIWL